MCSRRVDRGVDDANASAPGGEQFDPIALPSTVPPELVAFVDGINGLRSMDWSAVEGEVLADCREAFDRVGNAVRAAHVEFVRALDESMVWAHRRHRSVKGLFREGTNASPARQGRWRRAGAQLHRMPEARAAFVAGLIGTDHLRILRSCLARRFGDAYGHCEHLLVRWAIETDWDTFVNAVGTWQETFDLTDPTEVDEHADARGLHHSRSFEGLGVLDATLTPEQAEIFDSVMQPIVDELFLADWNEAAERVDGKFTEGDLCRTPAQRRVDAFEILCQRAASWGGGSARPLYVLHVGVDELRRALRRDAGLAPLDVPDGLGARLVVDGDDASGGRSRRSAAVTLRHYASGARASDRSLVRGLIDAHVRTLVIDDDGEVLRYSRHRRWFTKLQHQAMAARDRECRCGCGLRADLCHADHQLDWQFLGRSDIENAQALCPTSHRLKTADPSWAPPDRPSWYLGRAGPRLRRPDRGRSTSREVSE